MVICVAEHAAIELARAHDHNEARMFRSELGAAQGDARAKTEAMQDATLRARKLHVQVDHEESIAAGLRTIADRIAAAIAEHQTQHLGLEEDVASLRTKLDVRHTVSS